MGDAALAFAAMLLSILASVLLMRMLLEPLLGM